MSAPILICGKYSKKTSRIKEDDMGNKYEDFDLDLKSSEENSVDEPNTVTVTVTTLPISIKMKCTPKCPVPTKGKTKKPVASCYKKVQGTAQVRC